MPMSKFKSGSHPAAACQLFWSLHTVAGNNAMMAARPIQKSQSVCKNKNVSLAIWGSRGSCAPVAMVIAGSNLARGSMAPLQKGKQKIDPVQDQAATLLVLVVWVLVAVEQSLLFAHPLTGVKNCTTARSANR